MADVGSMVVSSGPFWPQLEVSGQLGSLHLLLTPRQLQRLQELFSAMSLAGEASGRSRGMDAWGGASQAGLTETTVLLLRPRGPGGQAEQEPPARCRRPVAD